MTAPLALSLALALASTAPPPRAAPAEPGDAGAQRIPALEAQPDGPVVLGHTGWRHELDLGAHSTTFKSKEGSRYDFHSATLGYAVSYGVTGPFLRIAALAPLRATQDGTMYATANYYRHRYGGDLLLGIQHRWTVRGLELEAGPGFHSTFIYLPARAGYRDFDALPMGIGAGFSLRWKTRYERLSRGVTVGATASVAYDFRDPAHQEDLSRGFALRLGFAVGLGARR